MRSRYLSLALVLLLLGSNSGCAVLRGLRCCMQRCVTAQCARTYGCDSCGETYHGEWCSDPPACHEPCDHCGNFNGACKNRWVGHNPGCPSCNGTCGCH